MIVVPQNLIRAPAVDEAAVPLFTGTVQQLIEALIEQALTA